MNVSIILFVNYFIYANVPNMQHTFNICFHGPFEKINHDAIYIY
jgi:hypothetical protein